MLREQLQHLDALEGQVGRVEQEIEIRTQPYAEQLRRLDTIPGISKVAAWTILAELGPDMRVFPDAAHAASWGGLCPGNRESGGKRLKAKTRKANRYLRRILCEAAWAATRKRDSYVSALYHRQRARIGHEKAIVALAHYLLRIAYTMLSRGEDYRELGSDYYDRRNRVKSARRLVERLERVGYRVALESTEEPLETAKLHATA